jgi:hypothetical protein
MRSLKERPLQSEAQHQPMVLPDPEVSIESALMVVEKALVAEGAHHDSFLSGHPSDAVWMQFQSVAASFGIALDDHSFGQCQRCGCVLNERSASLDGSEFCGNCLSVS